MNKFQFNRLICVTILMINYSISLGFSEGSDRSVIIEMELDCADPSKNKGEAIGWNDICYSWDKPHDYNREKAIDTALNDYEDNRIMKDHPFSHPDYPRLSDSWGKPLNTYKERPTESDERIEEWLKKDYPFFYQEHMEKKEPVKRYYGDEDVGKEDNRLASFFKNINYGAIFQSDVEPVYYFETVFPIFQSDELEHTIFSHDRISVVSGQDGSYTAGLGYRYYDEEAPYIIGANTFYDYQQHGDHYRMGYGAEFLKENIEARINFYDGLSPQRGRGVHSEQAVDGFDTEIGTTVPKFHLAKIYGGYQWYDYNHGDDRQGWSSRLELTPAPSLRFNLEAIDENNSEIRYRFDGRLNFNFTTFNPKDILADIKGESLEPTRLNFEDRLLDRVEREFSIRVESWTEEEEEPTVIGNLSNVSLIVRFPVLNCPGCGPDANADGIVQGGEGFEIDFFLENNTTVTATGISYTNEVTSTGWSFVGTPSTPPWQLGNVLPGASVQTDSVTDMDLHIPGGTPDGTSFTITLDFTADGQTFTVTFGPFVVGDIRNGDIISLL